MSEETVGNPQPSENQNEPAAAATSGVAKRKKQSSETKVSEQNPPEVSVENDRKSRRTPLFPASSFEEALTLPNAIQKHAGGQTIRRLTLFDQLKKSPDSGSSRQLVTNASKYGLLKGSYTAEHLELTPDGFTATSTDVNARDRLSIRFKLAIERVAPFKVMYDSLKGNRVPAPSVLEDMAKDKGNVPSEDAKECVELFVLNAKFVGILKPISGAERIIPIEQALEELPYSSPSSSPTVVNVPKDATSSADEYANVCFYISPIGEDDSEHRQHADLFLGSLVEPALEEFGLKVVRADKIGKAGMITSQIIEHIIKSRLVIADLSFHNPNVFYELALRHVCRLPTVQLIRKCDKIPFDLQPFRTIPIDTTSIFTMVPKLQTYQTEIAAQVRMALKDPDSVDNPVTTYCPSLRITFGP